VLTGVSGSGKSTLAFDTLLQESQRRFFYTLSHYTRQFLDLGTRPKVRKMTGLSPAIGLTQNETFPSRKSTLATLTDLTELIGVLFSRFGTRLCPTHRISTVGNTKEQIVATITEHHAGQYVFLLAPLVTQKKGIFAKELTQWREKGFVRAWVDGAFVDLAQDHALEKEKKHTLKLLVDVIRIQEKSHARLLRSVTHTLEEGDGYGEFFFASQADFSRYDPKKAIRFSTSEGCPTCAYSWPELDPRYFSANSLGACKPCNGYGALEVEPDSEEETVSVSPTSSPICSSCEGTGLDAMLRNIHLGGHSPLDWYSGSCDELLTKLARLQPEAASNPAYKRVLDEVEKILRRIHQLGIGYLQLHRRVRSLSLGEHQRLHLTGILSESLRGILYVLDEPSQGLHPHQLEELWHTFESLKAAGNTLVLVDHDGYFIEKADYVIDMGPGGGKQGGHIVYAGPPKKSPPSSLPPAFHPHSEAPAAYLEIRQAHLHTLQIPSVSFRLGALNLVTGISGAGKSSLVLQTLYPNLLAAIQARKRPTWIHCKELRGWESLVSVELIDRKLLHKSSASTPATYFDIFPLIRDLFSQSTEAQLLGLTSRHFSLHAEGGRCEVCKGKGLILHTMRFLAETKSPCPNCEGRRFKTYLEQIHYRGVSIADVLQMTLAEAHGFFAHHRKISQRLQPAIDLGLGYLSLGQPTSTLSGGEIQRMKLVPYFAKRTVEHTLFILDEPTRGLHEQDIVLLLACLRTLLAKGATLIVLEHHVGLMKVSDWLIDLGPGAAEKGGRVLYQGPPAGLKKVKESLTAKYLE